MVFGGLARRVTGARWLALFGCLAVTIGCGWAAATRLHVDNSTEGLLGSDSPAMATLDRLGDHFGQDKIFLIAAEGDVFTPDFLARLTELHGRIEDLTLDLPTLGMRREERRAAHSSQEAPATAAAPDAPAADSPDPWALAPGEAVQGLTPGGPRHVVHAIASLVNATDIRQTEQGLEQQRLIDPLPEESALPALREHVLADPALVDHVVSADGRMATIVLRTDFMSEADAAVVYDALQRILRESETDTFTLRLTGMAALEVALNRTMERDVTVVVSICLVAMLAILFFIFRGPFGVLGPLLVVLQAVVWTLGAMALAGAPMTGVTSVLASFLICVGMADSIHVQSVFRDLRRDGANARDAVVQALAVTGVPVLMTSLTTIAGLLSFRTASLSAVIDMGTYGAFGVAAALVLSLVFLPAFLTFHRGSGLGARAVAPQAGGAPHVPDMLDRILARCDAASRPVVVDGQRRYGRRNLTLVASLLIAGVSVFGLMRLEGRHDPLSWLPADHQARTSLEAVDRAMGGTATVHMLISAPLGQTLKHHDVISRLERLEAHALAYEAPGREGQRVVTNVTSVLDVLRQGQRALAQEQDAEGLPGSEQGIVDLFTLAESAGEEPLRQLITLDAQHAVMSLRVRWLEAGEYAPLEEHLTAGIREHIGTAAHVELTGSVYANFEVVSALIDNLAKSFLSAFVVIALLMIVMLGDFKLGLLAMLPNVLPVMVVGGVMGVLGVPLDLNTVLVASIAIGIAVDDTIHFFYQFHAFEPELGGEGAIAAAYHHTARAMVSTSVVLAVGFAAYGFAEMVNVQRFGLLITLSVAVALLADLVLTPALLRVAYRGSEGNAVPPSPSPSEHAVATEGETADA